MTCGQRGSGAHKRRIARWLPRARQLKTMGYLVITYPLDVRWRLKDRATLDWVYARTLEVLAGKRMGRRGRVAGYWKRGLARWHWFGDTPGKWHPHLNVLVDGGKLPEETLSQLRDDLARVVGYRWIQIHYEYSSEQNQMAGWIEYLTRPTFTNRAWSELAADTLYGFRSARAWGKWTGLPVWQPTLLDALDYDPVVEALVRGECPCGLPIRWRSECHALATLGRRPLGAGYYQLRLISLDTGPPA